MLKWASSLDQLWQTPGLVSLLTIGAAAFFALILIIVALRADKTFANGVLVLITLIATAALALSTFRHGPAELLEASSTGGRTGSSSASPSLAALACLDGLAGNGVESACERALFATPDAAAAAVSYTAAQLSRLSPSDAMGSRGQTVEGTALRRTLERDRFGLVAQVLTVREGCTPADCATFKIFSDPSRVVANMNERTYETTIGRYALSWPGGSTMAAAPPIAPAIAPGGMPALPGLPPQSVAAAPAPSPAPANMSTGRPTTIDFPSAASTPPVNIMIGEPPSTPIPPRAATPAKQPPKEAPKKQAAKQTPKAAPVQLAPPAADGAEEDN